MPLFNLQISELKVRLLSAERRIYQLVSDSLVTVILLADPTKDSNLVSLTLLPCLVFLLSLHASVSGDVPLSDGDPLRRLRAGGGLAHLQRRHPRHRPRVRLQGRIQARQVSGELWYLKA